MVKQQRGPGCLGWFLFILLWPVQPAFHRVAERVVRAIGAFPESSPYYTDYEEARHFCFVMAPASIALDMLAIAGSVVGRGVMEAVELLDPGPDNKPAPNDGG